MTLKILYMYIHFIILIVRLSVSIIYNLLYEIPFERKRICLVYYYVVGYTILFNFIQIFKGGTDIKSSTAIREREREREFNIQAWIKENLRCVCVYTAQSHKKLTAMRVVYSTILVTAPWTFQRPPIVACILFLKSCLPNECVYSKM